VFILFSFQLNYYNKVDSYIDYRCEYYDQYYNLIFASPRIYSCPVIDVSDEGTYNLTFTTNTTYLGTRNLNSLSLIDVSTIDPTIQVSVESVTITTIEYDEDYNITYYHNQITELISYGDTVVYTSSSKIVENTYSSDSFETIISYASIIDDSRNDTLHYPFEETDYEKTTTYTSKENILDYPITDIDFYLIQKTDGIDSDQVVGLGFDTGDIMYNLTEDQYSFSVTEYSNWSQAEGTHYRVSSRNQINSLGIYDNIYSLGYQLRDEGYYTLITKDGQDPNEYIFENKESWSFGNLTFEDNGQYSYYVMNGIYYTFIPTDYGYKVVDRRNHQYKLFASTDEQMKEHSLSIMNDQYLDLHDYYKNLTEYPYFVPQIMIRNSNPLHLKSLK